MKDFITKYVAPNISVSGSKSSNVDYVVTLWVAVALLVLRNRTEAIFLPVFRRIFMKFPTPTKKAYAILDNLWIGIFALALDLLAWVTTVNHNGGCTPWSADNCFLDWPNHVANLYQRWFMLLAFALYLSEMIGTLIGVGTKLSTSMWIHHVVTMLLIWISYDLNLVRMSCMWQALFDLSNPLLHFAKACDKAEFKSLVPVKWFLFNLFALTFLVCRVILGLVSILRPSFTVAAKVLPLTWLYPCWGLELTLYSLQVFWFYKIVQIAIKGDKAVKDD